MKVQVSKEHRSEILVDGTAWKVDATAAADHLVVELVAASTTDGTVAVQLRLDGDAAHLAMVEDIARELQSALCGRPRRRRPGPYGLAVIRQGLPRAYAPWTDEDERTLLDRWDAGESVESVAHLLQRGPGGVRSRLVKLGRIEEAS